MNTIKIDSKNVKMIAHRGLSGLEKENTNAAFVAAGNREKYFGIETDVHVTRDGRFIIIHDDDTERVAGNKLSVEGSTYDLLKKVVLLDIDEKQGRTDLVLPDLEDYINICRKYEKTCILELKNHFVAADICKIVTAIEKTGYLDKVVFISFDAPNCTNLRKILPNQTIQFLLEKVTDEDLEYMKQYSLDLDAYYVNLSKEIIDRVHAFGQKVNCWTVNDAEAAEQLIEWGVDYITTNILE